MIENIDIEYELLGHINGVIVEYREDKANVEYSELKPNNLNKEFAKTLESDDDYGYYDNVPVVKVSNYSLTTIAYKLMDLDSKLLKYTKEVLSKVTHRRIECTTFILCDGKCCLFVLSGGCDYPRFKGTIDKNSNDEVLKLFKKAKLKADMNKTIKNMKKVANDLKEEYHSQYIAGDINTELSNEIDTLEKSISIMKKYN